MALWTDSTKFLWTGRSGLQYRKKIPVNLTHQAAKTLIADFFHAAGAKQRAGQNEGMLSFTRGGASTSRLSWIFPCSEKWPGQDIVVEFGTDALEVSYDVKMGCCMVFAPNSLATEAAELELLLLGKAPIKPD